MTEEPKGPFRVRLWCRDCTGEDPKGCFDGGTELLRERGDEPRTFETLRDAVDAGYAETRDCGPWEFEVIDAEDEEIDIDQMTESQIDKFGIEET